MARAATLAALAAVAAAAAAGAAAAPDAPPRPPPGPDDDDAFACIYAAVDEADALACVADALVATAVAPGGVAAGAAAGGGGGGAPDKGDASRAVEYAMGRGWWDAAARVIDAGVDVTTAVHQTSSRIRARMSALTDALSKASTAAGIPPAFEWAQSPDSIFLNGEA